jgi:hypothetical protein
VASPQLLWLKSVDFVDSFPVAWFTVLMMGLDLSPDLWAATVAQEIKPSRHNVNARSTYKYMRLYSYEMERYCTAAAERARAMEGLSESPIAGMRVAPRIAL